MSDPGTRTSFRDPSSRTVVRADRVFRAFTAEGWRVARAVLETETMRRRLDAGDVVGCRAANEATLDDADLAALRDR